MRKVKITIDWSTGPGVTAYYNGSESQVFENVVGLCVKDAAEMLLSRAKKSMGLPFLKITRIHAEEIGTPNQVEVNYPLTYQ